MKLSHFRAISLSLIELSHVIPTRPERAEAPSPGHRPGGNYGHKLVALSGQKL